VVGLRGRFPIDVAGFTLAVSALALLYGGFRAFYFQSGFLESMSYYSDERPFNAIVNGWIGRDPAETLYGVHAFGDYLLLNVWAQFPDPWGQMEQVNYLPPVLLFYKVMGLLPYSVGLTLFLVFLVLCLVLPMVLASRGRPIGQRLILVTTLALLTGPALATLDRANNQGFLPLLLFGFGIAILREKWGWASVFIAIAAMIKIYPIVLILLLIALRKYKWALVSVGITGIAVIATLPLTSTEGLAGLTTVIGDVLQWQERTTDSFLEYNASFAGGLANLLMFAGLDALGTWIAANALIIIAVYAVVVIPLLWSTRVPLWLRIILVLSLTTALMPITYPYALNWVLAATAITVWVSRRGMFSGALPQRIALSLAASLSLITAVLPIFIPGSMEAGRPATAASLASLVVAIALPMVAVWSRSRAAAITATG